jgi:glutathione S-transferase
MFKYTAIVTILSVLLYFYISTRVSAARRKFGVKLPAVSGHPDFERVFRAHMNTLEWMPIYLPLLWLAAFYFNDLAAAAVGVVWIVGRAMYLAGYTAAVEKRSQGFFIQAMACIVLLVGAVAGIAMRFISG